MDILIPVVLALIPVLYFVPTIIGFIKKKDNKVAILALNLFLGWTLIGWVVSLVWALSQDKAQTIIINNNGSQP